MPARMGSGEADKGCLHAAEWGRPATQRTCSASLAPQSSAGTCSMRASRRGSVAAS